MSKSLLPRGSYVINVSRGALLDEAALLEALRSGHRRARSWMSLTRSLHQPITRFVRTLTDEEQQRIQAGLHSSDAFVLRRCQIVLASARGEKTITIVYQLSCDDQTVRNVIKQFNADGVGVLQAGSFRPHRLQTVMDAHAITQAPAILHRPPRDFGKEQSFWSLEALAQVCLEQGLTTRPLAIERMRKILRRLGINWKRAKHHINSPDAWYEEKNARDRLIDWASHQASWAIGFQDEV